MYKTYTQLHIQFIFTVRYREPLIHPFWKDRLLQFITGSIQGQKHKLIQINSMPDHIHILIGLRPNQSISFLMQNVKSGSTKWINDCKLTSSKFAWRDVIRYIQQQEDHHRKEHFSKNTKTF